MGIAKVKLPHRGNRPGGQTPAAIPENGAWR